MTVTRPLAATAVWGWATFLTAMGAFWTLGGSGYPFGANDVNGPAYTSLLSGIERHAGGPGIIALGVLALVLSGQLHTTPRSARHRGAVIGAGTVLAVGLIGVVADGRMILLLPPLGLFPIAWLAAATT